MAILVWESLDPDSIDRAIQPIYIDYMGNEQHTNKLNAYMDHNCDSFYTSQQRIARFPGLVYAPAKDGAGAFKEYNVRMTGTPPKKMRWRLDVQTKTSGIKVSVFNPGATSMALTINDEEVAYNAWDKSISANGVITGSKCGENRYVSSTNMMEFYLTGECEIKLIPRDAIVTQIRMDFTLDGFFESGGTTAFIDRLCASLGIHWSTVKVVGVSEGSVIVNYEITPSADEPMSIEQI